MSTKARILVADDHTLFRRGLSAILCNFVEVGSVSEAKNGEEVLKHLSQAATDIVLLDLGMPVMDGWEAAKRIISDYPDTHIIMVSMHDSLKIIADLIEIGVHGYLLKNADPEDMHRAIRCVLDDQVYYNQIMAKAVESNLASLPAVNATINLTKREIEIMQLICHEMSTKEISEELIVSFQTVSTHRRNLMKKIQAKNCVSIVRYAVREGIVRL